MPDAMCLQLRAKELGLVGWKSKKTSRIDFYRCPNCGHCQESIFYGPDEMTECFHCNKRFRARKFLLAKVQRPVVECGRCGASVSITESNSNIVGIGYLCPACQSYVAVEYGRRMVHPLHVLELDWNPTIRRRGERVDDGLLFTRCRTKKDYLVVQLLQVMAKKENPRFMFVRERAQFAGLYFDAEKLKYLGFLVWTVTGKHAVLRQIFIVPHERRKGLAERLVVFWVERYADRVNDTFGIEGPNEKALKLHEKLGHVRIEGESVKGLKCFFAPTF